MASPGKHRELHTSQASVLSRGDIFEPWGCLCFKAVGQRATISLAFLSMKASPEASVQDASQLAAAWWVRFWTTPLWELSQTSSIDNWTRSPDRKSTWHTSGFRSCGP